MESKNGRQLRGLRSIHDTLELRLLFVPCFFFFVLGKDEAYFLDKKIVWTTRRLSNFCKAIHGHFGVPTEYVELSNRERKKLTELKSQLEELLESRDEYANNVSSEETRKHIAAADKLLIKDRNHKPVKP